MTRINKGSNFKLWTQLGRGLRNHWTDLFNFQVGYFKKVSAFPVYAIYAFNIETVQDKSCLDNNFYAVKTVFFLTPGYFFQALDNLNLFCWRWPN